VDGDPLAILAFLCDRVSHKMRTHLSVVGALVEDASTGFALEKQDFLDAKGAFSGALDLVSLFEVFGYLKKDNECEALDIRSFLTDWLKDNAYPRILDSLDELNESVECRFDSEILRFTLPRLVKWLQCRGNAYALDMNSCTVPVEIRLDLDRSSSPHFMKLILQARHRHDGRHQIYSHLRRPIEIARKTGDTEDMIISACEFALLIQKIRLEVAFVSPEETRVEIEFPRENECLCSCVSEQVEM